MKRRRQRHLRVAEDKSAGDVDTDPESGVDSLEIVLTDTSGFDWSDVVDDAEALHQRLKRLAAEVVLDEGAGAGTLHLFLIDPGFMGYLNKTFMDHDGPTDVLAFPIDGPEVVDGVRVDLSRISETGVEIDDIEGGGEYTDRNDNDFGSVPVHLGDVMVCPQVAARQAPDHTGSLTAELSLLVIHGVLHVLGHDHAEPAETARMRSRERRHLDRLGYRHPFDR